MAEAANIDIEIDGRSAQAGAAIVVRSLSDIRSAANSLATDLDAVDKTILKLGQSLSGLGAGFGGLDKSMQSIASGIQKISGPTKLATGDLGELNKILQRSVNLYRELMKPANGGNGIPGIAAAVKTTSGHLDAIAQKSNDLSNRIQNDTQTVEQLTKKTESLYDELTSKVKSNLEETFDWVLEWANKFSTAVTVAFSLVAVVKFVNFIRETKGTFTALWPVISGVAKSLSKVLVPAIQMVRNGFLALTAVAWANPIVAIIGVVALAIAGIATYIYQNWDVLSDWGGHFVSLGDVITAVFDEITDRFSYWTKLFKVDVKLIVATAKLEFQLMGEFFVTVFKRMGAWVDSFKNYFGDVFSNIGDIWNAIWDRDFSKAKALAATEITFKGPDGSFAEAFKKGVKEAYEESDIPGLLNDKAGIEKEFAHLRGGIMASLDRRLAEKEESRMAEDRLAAMKAPENKALAQAEDASEAQLDQLDKIQQTTAAQNKLITDQTQVIQGGTSSVPDAGVQPPVAGVPATACCEEIKALISRLGEPAVAGGKAAGKVIYGNSGEDRNPGQILQLERQWVQQSNELLENQHQLTLAEQDSVVFALEGIEAGAEQLNLGDDLLAQGQERLAVEDDLLSRLGDQNDAYGKLADSAKDGQQQLADGFFQPFADGLRQVKGLISSVFDDLFAGNLKKAKDYWQAFVDIGKNALKNFANTTLTSFSNFAQQTLTNAIFGSTGGSNSNSLSNGDDGLGFGDVLSYGTKAYDFLSGSYDGLISEIGTQVSALGTGSTAAAEAAAIYGTEAASLGAVGSGGAYGTAAGAGSTAAGATPALAVGGFWAAFAVAAAIIIDGFFKTVDNNPNPRVQSNFGVGDDGQLITASSKLTDIGQEDGQVIVDQFNDVITGLMNDMIDSFDLTLTEFEDGAAQLIYSKNNGFQTKINGELVKDFAEKESSPFIAEPGGDPQTVMRFSKGEEAFAEAIADFITRFTEAFTEEGELPETMAKVFANTTAETLEEFLADVNFGIGFETMFKPVQQFVEKTAGPFEIAFDALNEQFDATREKAEELGLELGTLNANIDKATAKFAQDFDKFIGQQIAGITTPVLGELVALQQQTTTAMDEALAVGGDVLQVAELYTLMLADISGAQGDAASEAEASIASFTGLAEQLRDFRSSLLLGDLSTLSPLGKLDENRAQFEDVSRRAQLGDIDAIGDLPGVAQSFLEASQFYNASSEAYASDFAQVMDVLDTTETVAERQVSIAEDQLSALSSIDTGISVMQDAIMTVLERAFAGEQDLGLNPARNTILAAASGYTGDFGNGGFGAFATQTTQGQDLGNNPTLNRLLAAASNFTGDFGGGRFQQYIQGASGLEKQAAREIMLAQGLVPGFNTEGVIRTPTIAADNIMPLFRMNQNEEHHIVRRGRYEEQTNVLTEVRDLLKLMIEHNGAIASETIIKLNNLLDATDETRAELERSNAA